MEIVGSTASLDRLSPTIQSQHGMNKVDEKLIEAVSWNNHCLKLRSRRSRAIFGTAAPSVGSAPWITNASIGITFDKAVARASLGVLNQAKIDLVMLRLTDTPLILTQTSQLSRQMSGSYIEFNDCTSSCPCAISVRRNTILL
jgi:hypothetical protein